MAILAVNRPPKSALKTRKRLPLSEIGSPKTSEWLSLHESSGELGFSFNWHDFKTDRDFDWAGTFRPPSLEVCLNMEGTARIRTSDQELLLGPSMIGYYAQTGPGLTAVRKGGEHHQFMTVVFSQPFLKRLAGRAERGLHSTVTTLLAGGGRTMTVSEPVRLTCAYRQMLNSLLHPPVCQAAQEVWYHAKALEVAAALLYNPSPEEMICCDRRKSLNQERVQKVITILNENLSESISLEEIARLAGCSRFYLCRIFTEEMGLGICKYLRNLRMERAVTLLREGKSNITEVALAVGYSSASHFSTAFRETYGCCPTLFLLPNLPGVNCLDKT